MLILLRGIGSIFLEMKMYSTGKPDFKQNYIKQLFFDNKETLRIFEKESKIIFLI